MRDITGGAPVAGLALGQRSAAGEVWLGSNSTDAIDRVRVIGDHIRSLTSEPTGKRLETDERFDRQARLFGASGQELLREAHVAVIGAGGGGSMLIEQLAHLGVGHLTLVDFDVVKRINLSRIVGATAADAQRRRKKVDVLADLVSRIDPRCEVTPIDGDLTDLDVVESVLDCDFMFLATDTIASRLVFNAIVHRYLIPGIQIGAKVEVSASGDVDQVYVAVRPVWPDAGCLQCSSLIAPEILQRENRTEEEVAAQNYLDEPEVIDPSVVTLNGIAASHATTEFLFALTGLGGDSALRHRLIFPLTGETLDVTPRKNADCRFCGASDLSEFGRGGPPALLPVRRSQSSAGRGGPAPRLLQRIRRRVVAAMGLREGPTFRSQV